MGARRRSGWANGAAAARALAAEWAGRLRVPSQLRAPAPAGSGGGGGGGRGAGGRGRPGRGRDGARRGGADPGGLVPRDVPAVAGAGHVAAGGGAPAPPALPLPGDTRLPQVLIIGGGDGGVLREVVKHPTVESVVQCEIDEDVIQVSKKYLPGMAVGYSSAKLTLHVGDGFEFMKQNQEAFDVIITDSSDPMGPAESLFKESYYQLMKTALREDGILCCQGECQWLHLDLIKEMRQFCKSLFPVVEYAYCTIPTYPSGQIGFMLCSKNPNTNFREPVQQLSQQQVEERSLKYYNSDIHRAAFILPEFARKALSDV
uniref:Spermidine synthase n=1 Tax=Calidris pygmaea TaxID=425635 RepID=A0A8C3JYB1_9CHAR